MTETQENIRSSLLTTLSFLASEAQQREFAAKVFYASYQDEFACWWFDTFFPDELAASEMFKAKQLAALRAFSIEFDRCLKTVGSGQLTIGQLQANVEWQSLVAKARVTFSEIENAI